ncbi:hypothetical protein R5R35_004504 [Gryllus longicercus]|uniref:Uncharacterized protein n=1 Tax=Gryllus longicercus TaxID=2509291 RepID=A0AAN9Z7V3_9ORTH
MEGTGRRCRGVSRGAAAASAAVAAAPRGAPSTRPPPIVRYRSPSAQRPAPAPAPRHAAPRRPTVALRSLRFLRAGAARAPPPPPPPPTHMPPPQLTAPHVPLLPRLKSQGL